MISRNSIVKNEENSPEHNKKKLHLNIPYRNREIGKKNEMISLSYVVNDHV